jgi:hypothetical protein
VAGEACVEFVVRGGGCAGEERRDSGAAQLAYEREMLPRKERRVTRKILRKHRVAQVGQEKQERALAQALKTPGNPSAKRSSTSQPAGFENHTMTDPGRSLAKRTTSGAETPSI